MDKTKRKISDITEEKYYYMKERGLLWEVLPHASGNYKADVRTEINKEAGRMTTEQLFEKHEMEYLETSKAELKYSDRPDLNAFIMLDKLDGGDMDIVAHAEHDQIFLNVSDETIENLTEEQVLELLYCGVTYRYDGLMMFV